MSAGGSRPGGGLAACWRCGAALPAGGTGRPRRRCRTCPGRPARRSRAEIAAAAAARRVCRCGARKLRDAALCLECDLEMRGRRAAARRVCPCGRRRDRESPKCLTCELERRAAGSARRRELATFARVFRGELRRGITAIERAWRLELERRGRVMAHICPNCGAEFLGPPAAVGCSSRCTRKITKRGRYPSIRGLPVAERNKLATLIALMRAANRRLHDARG